MIRSSYVRSLNGVGRFSGDSSKRCYSIAVAASKSRRRAHNRIGRSNCNAHLNVTYNAQRTFITSWFSQPKTSPDSLTKEPTLSDAQPSSTLFSQPPPSSSSASPPLTEQSASSLSTLQTPPTSSSLSHIESSTNRIPLDDLIKPEQLENLNLGHVVEKIGFLKDLGLDYGWGPTAIVQWLLEHVHIWTDTPWWASIVITALIVRVSLIKLFFKSADVAARQRALMPVIEPIQKRIKVAKANRDQDALQNASQEIKQVFKMAGFNPFSILTPTAIQGMLGFGTFRLLRGMATLPVPGLKDGGLGWVKDLTLPDPYYVLPAAVAVSMHLFIRIGGETGNHDLQTRFRPVMLYALPAVSFVFMIWQPSALQVSFVAATAIAIIQNSLLKSTRVRQWLGITPLYELESETLAAGTKASASAKEVAAAVAAKKRKENPSSVKNIIATPQYQPPTARPVLRAGRQQAAGRTFSSSSPSPNASAASAIVTPTAEHDTVEPEKPKETWLFRTIISAKNKVGESIEAGKKAIGMGGPPPESQNTTTNEVKTRGYLRDAAMYEAERQEYFRDLRVRKVEEEAERERERERERKEAEESLEAGRREKMGMMKVDGDEVKSTSVVAGELKNKKKEGGEGEGGGIWT